MVRSLQNVRRFFHHVLRANPVYGFFVADADVVYDGEDDAECCDAEEYNPVNGFEVGDRRLKNLLKFCFHGVKIQKMNNEYLFIVHC